LVTGATATTGATVTFTANTGVVASGNGTINTALNYSTATNFRQNSAMIAGWTTMGTTADNNCVIGGSSASYETDMQPYNFGAAIGGGINGSSGFSVSVATGSGLTAFDRSASALTAAYRNGSSIGTITAASSAPSSQTAQGLECAGSGTSFTENVAMIAVGASLGATKELALYNRVHTFLHAINGTLYP
jgi:hypothetical protein